MIKTLTFVVFIAILNTGIYLLLLKWNIIRDYEIHKKKWMPNCTFCLFFWLAAIEIGKMQIPFTNWMDFVVVIKYALVAAVISRKMV